MGKVADSRTWQLWYFFVLNVGIFFKYWKSVTAVVVCYPICFDNIDRHMINDTVDYNTHSLQISDFLFAIWAKVKVKSSVMLLFYCVKFPANSGCTFTV